jgi:hypothetical protein
MADLNINVKVDFSGIKQKFSPENKNKARFQMASQMFMDMNRFVPERSGNLRKLHIIATDGAHITWTQPYARVQFYGSIFFSKGTLYHFEDDEGVHFFWGDGKTRHWAKARNGFPRWDLKAKPLYMDKWEAAFKKALMKG